MHEIRFFSIQFMNEQCSRNRINGALLDPSNYQLQDFNQKITWLMLDIGLGAAYRPSGCCCTIDGDSGLESTPRVCEIERLWLVFLAFVRSSSSLTNWGPNRLQLGLWIDTHMILLVLDECFVSDKIKKARQEKKAQIFYELYFNGKTKNHRSERYKG